MEAINFLQQYWFIILFIGGVIASWARYEMKINILEKNVTINHKTNQNEIEKLKLLVTAQEKATDNFREGMGRNIQEIQTTMKFILEAIKEMKNK